MRSEGDHFLCGLDGFIGLLDAKQPFGEQLPAPIIIRVFFDGSFGAGDGVGDVAALGFDPGGADL